MTKTIYKKAKQDIRLFLQTAYTDENLAQLLAHAQNGKLVYKSCCCLVGIPTADHALKEEIGYFNSFNVGHVKVSRKKFGNIAVLAEAAFSLIGHYYTNDISDVVRRNRIIPMVRAEMRRRDRLKSQQQVISEIEYKSVTVG